MPQHTVIAPLTPSVPAPEIVTDPHWASVVLMLGFDDVASPTQAVDESPSAHGVMTFNHGATLTSDAPLVGAGSYYGDGDTEFGSYADHVDWYLPGEFTIDVVFRFHTQPNKALSGLLTHYNATTSQRAWALAGNHNTEQLIFQLSTTGLSNNNARLDLGSPGWEVDRQYHARATRDASNVCRVALDGVVGGTTFTASGMHNSNAPLRIGNYESGGANWGPLARIDEVRITKGVARQIDGVVTLPFPRA